MGTITKELLNRYRKNVKKDEKIPVLNAAMARTEIKDLAYLPTKAAKLNGEFEVNLKTHGITAQRKSGRCWLFATMNIMREKVMEKTGLEKFELSGNFLSFYDKLEKANNFLEMVIANADKDMDDRMTDYIFSGIGDGGYFEMARDLVKKYGVVPKECMPESYQSEHTDKLDEITNTLLKKDAMLLRKAVKDNKDAKKLKEKFLEEIYRINVIAFGEPVESFDFSYRDKDGKNFHEDKNITPKEFYDKYVGEELDKYITVVNEPMEKRKMYQVYTVHHSCCMTDKTLHSLNLPMDELETMAIKQLKDNTPVWFACDVGAFGDRKEGVLDPDSFSYEGLLGGITFDQDKGTRLISRSSGANHAMVLVGVNFDKNKTPNRWKIENSWGKDVGKDGYFVCSEKYFKEFVYEVIVKKEYLSKKAKDALNRPAIELLPWEI